MAGPVRTVEVRVLDGPNLYFPRPAVKLTLDVAGWLRVGEDKVETVARATGRKVRGDNDLVAHLVPVRRPLVTGTIA